MSPPGHRRVRFLLTAVACAIGCLLPVPPAVAAPTHEGGSARASAAYEFQQVTLAKGGSPRWASP